MKYNLKIIGGRILSILFAVFLTACGSGGGGGGDGGSNGGVTTYKIADYYPLGQGDTWSYTDTEDGSSYTKTVNGTESINGVEAVKVVKDSGDYELMTLDNNGITVYKHKHYGTNWPGGWIEEVFNPPTNSVPSEISIGRTYTSNSSIDYTDGAGGSATGTVSQEITVQGVEDITVPAGTFNDCLKVIVKRNGNIGTTNFLQEETVWFAKSIGIVRNVGTSSLNGQTDTWSNELVTATVGGISYPSVVGSGYYEIYGAQAGDYTLSKTGHQLIGTSQSGNSFNVSGYSRFILYVPPTSSKILFDAIGLGAGWVDSQPGAEYAHHTSNMNLTGGSWAQNDSWVEGPPDGRTMENTVGSNSFYGFTTNGATTLTVYIKP